MRTLDKILYPKNLKYGAPMGIPNTGEKPVEGIKIYDCAVPITSDGAYSKDGTYWGIGTQLRVSYTKNLSYIRFYRKGDK